MTTEALDRLSVIVDDAERALSEAVSLVADEIGQDELYGMLTCARRLSGMALARVNAAELAERIAAIDTHPVYAALSPEARATIARNASTAAALARADYSVRA